jgi:hypothetical protein
MRFTSTILIQLIRIMLKPWHSISPSPSLILLNLSEVDVLGLDQPATRDKKKVTDIQLWIVLALPVLQLVDSHQ